MTPVKAAVFDLDGVIWLGKHAIPGVAEALKRLRSSDIQIRFFTNNASSHRSAYVEKLAAMDIPAAFGEIITSGFAAARHFAKLQANAKVHVMGSAGLMQECEEAGLRLVHRGADAVIVGYDREFSWEKLDIAFQNIFADGALFIACNQDRRYVEQDCFRPGTGPCVAALSYALEREPDIVAGKPHQAILDALFENLPFDAGQCVLVGDKLYTDIRCGLRAGMQTVLVRTGHGTEEERKITQEIKPDLVLDSVRDLPEVLEAAS